MAALQDRLAHGADWGVRRWFLTRHALERMNEMGLSRSAVVGTLEHPALTWPTHKERRVAAGNEISVVFDPSNLAVITVLWHTDEEWTREPGTRRRGYARPAVA